MTAVRAVVIMFFVLLLSLGVVQAASAAPGDITVAEGETLSLIAARHGVGIAELARTNGIADPDLIRAGQTLVLPGVGASAHARSARARHTVTAGETLAGIAAKYGVAPKAIAAANKIADPNVIVIGARLSIPGAAVAVKPVASAPATHHVVAGESLAVIARRYGVTVRAIARKNGIKNPNLITAGKRLRLPLAATGLPGVTATTQPRINNAKLPAVSKSEVRRLIDLHSDRHGVPRGLTRAIAWQESGFQQTVISHTGAIGVMQLMPDTARWVGQDLLGRPFDPTNVADNVEGGVILLKWLTQRAGSRDEAIAGYYQGLNSVQTRGFYDDTSQYVKSVNALVGQV